jgi:hypothetical protein
VFNVEREEHASRIARKEIGQRLENIPLEVIEVEVIEEDDGETESATSAESDDESVAAEETDSEDDEVLPEFEDLIE